MFKRTAVALSLLALSSIAAAQQPAAWPWQPVQVWAVPANGQAVPFPTPFWLWVVPPGTVPTPVAPTVKSEPVPANPTAVVPPVSEPTPVEMAPGPVLITAPATQPATVSSPVAVPAVTPVEVPLPVATPTPAPEETKAAASVEVPPAAIKRAPVAKKIRKSVSPTPARPVRKLCFKGGKLDVCP